MAVAGFGGKVRRKPPADTAWFATSFVLTVVYWIACSCLLPNGLYWEALFPVYAQAAWPALLIPIVPFVMTLALSFIFRVPDRTFWTWVLVIWAAETVTGFATFLSLMLLAVLGR